MMGVVITVGGLIEAIFVSLFIGFFIGLGAGLSFDRKPQPPPKGRTEV